MKIIKNHLKNKQDSTVDQPALIETGKHITYTEQRSEDAERELKAALIRLRQGFIAAIENRDKLSQLLGSAATNLLPVLRAMLWLVEKNRPDDTENAIKACTEAFEVDCGAIASAKKLRRIAKPPPMPDIKNLFESVYTCVEKLAELVDKLEV